MSDADEDVQESGSTRKRRGQLERQDMSELGELGVKGSKGRETDPGVKEVTRGVKVVELEDRKEESRTDGGKEATSEAVDGESNVTVTAPRDLAHAPQPDDDPSQDVTATDDKDLVDQSEAAAESPSNDPSEVEAPTSGDTKGPPIQDEKEEAPPDTTSEDRSEEVADAGESAEAETSPEP